MSKEETQFGKGRDPKAAQEASAKARKANKRRRDAILAAFKSGEMTAQDAAMFDRMLLMATKKELTSIATNEALPADIRRRARMLMSKSDKDAMAAAETLRDRAFGRPKQVAEIDGSLQTEQTMTFVGLPSPEND